MSDAPSNSIQTASSTERQRYREVISHFATGVAVVTAQSPEGPVGMTANALCSLSLDPLLLLVCFDNSARTLPSIQTNRRFAVNILRDGQQALSDAFASKQAKSEHFAAIPWRVHQQVPVLEEALAWLVCDLREMHPGGDHTIGIGTVTDMDHDEHGQPLLFYQGRYVGLLEEGPALEQEPL